MASALEQFSKGTLGQSAKKIKLSKLAAEDIHKVLIRAGFRHRRESLQVHPVFAPQEYFTKSGVRHIGIPTEEDAIPMDIYDHSDGSVVRMKAWGIPDVKYLPRTIPHLSKSVVFELEEKCILGLFSCHLDTSWENEAFKVSDDGLPLPKSPAKSSGILLPQNKEAIAQRIDVIMSNAHINIVTKYSSCPVD